MGSRYALVAFIACGLAVLTGCPVGPDVVPVPGIDPGGGVNPGIKPLPAGDVPGGNVYPGTPMTGTPGTATTVPGQFRGTWRATLTYVPAFYKGIIEVHDSIGSIGVSLYLGADGAYQFDLDSALSYFDHNCVRTTSWTDWGTVSMAGADFTFTPVRAIDSVMDSCGQSRYVDPAPVSPATHTLRLDQDQTGWPTLHFSLPNGEELLLERCRDCG